MLIKKIEPREYEGLSHNRPSRWPKGVRVG